ncbi:MAG: hypothetical protein Q9208_005357 [Pyrenodesmia sp. 3 TL-2023]
MRESYLHPDIAHFDNNRVFEQLYTSQHSSYKSRPQPWPPRSLTPALVKALQAVASEEAATEDGKLYTTVDIFDMIKAELSVVSRGTGRPRVELENMRYDTSLEEHIVLQPLPLPEASG